MNHSILSLALSRVTSRVSRRSSLTIDSAAPHFINNGGKTLPLATFCALIDRCASLERATIMSVECFRERTSLGVLHRTLILHLQRQGRTDVWLRIDRRRAEGVSIPSLALRGGKTESNDVAQLASSKIHLLRRPTAQPENRIEFASPPNLGAFRFFLQVICEELLEYHVWPANCWFLCSLLQEHLYEVGSGSFVIGNQIYLGLAPQIRSQVRSRIHHQVSSPPSMIEFVTTLTLLSPYAHVRRSYLLALASSFEQGVSSERQSLGTVHLLASEFCAIYRDLSRPILDDGLWSLLFQLAVRVFDLHRMLYRLDPSLGPSQIIVTMARFKLQTAALTPRLHTEFVTARRYFEEDPSVHWHYLASAFTHISLMSPHRDPELDRSCVVEAYALMNLYTDGSNRWTRAWMFGGIPSSCLSLAVSPDGREIASGRNSWDLETRAVIGEKEFEDNTMGPIWLDGNIPSIATCYINGGSHIVSVSAAGALTCRATHGHAPGTGKWPSAGRRELMVRDATMVHSFRWHRWSKAAFSLNGACLVSATAPPLKDEDQRVPFPLRVWDVATGQELMNKSFEDHNGLACTIAISPDGRQVVSALEDGIIQFWNVMDGSPARDPWALNGHVSCIRFSPDGRVLYLGAPDFSVQRRDVATGEHVGIPLVGHTDLVTSLAFSPDGKRIASTSLDGSAIIWEAFSGERISHPFFIGLDTSSGATLSQFVYSYGRGVLPIAFHPDGRRIIVGHRGGWIGIWDLIEDP